MTGADPAAPEAPVVRRAGPADVDAVTALHAPLHRLHEQALPEEYPPFDAEATRAYYAGVLDEGRRPMWVAEIGGVPVGFAGGEVEDREATPFTRAVRVLHVHQVAVAPDAQRRGVARALMQAVDEQAARLGCAQVRLQHLAFNEGAHRFYSSVGYRTRVLTMAKDVPPPVG